MTPTVTGITRLDLAVLGGGAIGAACARAAALRGLSVALLEPGPAPGAASPASAGMLAAQIEPGDDWWLALAMRARDGYAALAQDLRQTTGIDIGLHRSGIATIAFTADRARVLEDNAARQHAAGARVEWLTPQELERRWPGAAPGCTGALFAPDDGAVDPPTLTGAFTADAVRRGVMLIRERATSVVHTAGRITAVATPAGTVAARNVVIAMGAWSAALTGLPRPLPVSPVRGQLVQTAWPRSLAPAILYHEHGYVLCRGDHAILGSTMEHVGFDARVTDGARDGIVADARRLVPALGEPQRQWAGLRPITPDGLPILGPDPDVEGLWYATGHGRNGILLAALTGDIIAEWITTGVPSTESERLGVERFSAAVTHHAPRTTHLS